MNDKEKDKKLREILDNCPDYVQCCMEKEYFSAYYSVKGTGFGSFHFSIIDKVIEPDTVPKGRLSVNSECMSHEFVKKIMCKLIDEAEWDWDDPVPGQSDTGGKP